MKPPPPHRRQPGHINLREDDVGRRDDVSWVSLIRTARVSYALQALVAAGLLLPSQMRDMLAALTETHDVRAWAAFPVSLAVFGFLSWYWARATLSARFDLPDTRACWDMAVAAGQRGRRPFVRNGPLHIVPQAPIPIAGVTGLLVAVQSGAIWLGAGTLATLLGVWFLVDQRRAIRARLRRIFLPHVVFTEEPLPPESLRLRSTYSVRIWMRRIPYRFGVLMRRAPSGPWPAGLLLAVSVLAFTLSAAVSFFPATRGDDWRNLIWTVWRGPTPLLLGCALMVGPLSVLSFVMDGLRVAVWVRDGPIGLSRPPVMSTLLIASILMPTVVPLHAVRIVPLPAGVSELPRRPTLAAQWDAWRAACGVNTRPVVVAVSGGASRAALWGAAVLAEIDRAAEGRNAAIFGVSTVSGGSLGTASYLTARAANHAGRVGSAAGCHLPVAVRARFEAYAKSLGAADAIGPLLAGFILSDMPRSLLGWAPAALGAPMRGGDRAAALERAFEANAARAARKAGLAARPFDTGYLALAQPGMPLWLGVATERDTGGRVLITPVRGGGAGTQWPFQGAEDLLAQVGADMPISTVINATARFPFLEPSGIAPGREHMRQTLALIDGGYYDQSGMETALELAEWLRAQGADPILVAATGSGYGNGLGAGATQAAQDDVVRCGAGEFKPDQPPMTSMAADILAPLVGLYEARAGHVDTLLRRARAAWCTPHQAFFHFYLGALGAEPVPLNWVLSKRMADHVWLSAIAPPAGQRDGSDEAGDVFVEANWHEADRLRAVLGTAP